MKSGEALGKKWSLALLGLLFLLGCGGPKAEQVVAKVDDIEITVGDVHKVMRRQRLIYEGKSKSSETFFKEKQRILNDLIDKKLLLREAQVKGTMIAEEDFQKELSKYKSSYTEVSFQKMLHESGMSNEEWIQIKRENFIITQFLKSNSHSGLEISPDAVQKYYEEHIQDFKTSDSVHVRQIVTDTKEKAESILRRLQNGENFAKLARDLSLSPDRKEGGDLGFMIRGSFPREFEVCFSMNPGEISPIIPSIYGFHIFKVIEKVPAKTQDIMEVHDKIVTLLKQKTQQQRLQDLLKELRQKAVIQIDESLLKRITL